MSPRILLPGKLTTGATGVRGDSYSNGLKYAEAVARAGGVVTTVAPLAEHLAHVASLVASVDGVLVQGGGDIDPARYGAAKRSDTVYGIVEAHEAGLLFVDGRLVERLEPGRHAFWQVGRTVRIAKVDLRPQPLEVTAQEILTKDRVGIRVTLTAFTRVLDPEKAVLGAGDVPAMVYKLVQFAIREGVATRTLDEILAARDTIDTLAEESGLQVVDEGAEDDSDLDSAAEDASIIRFVNQFLKDAIELRASDIHLEPFEDELRTTAIATTVSSTAKANSAGRQRS